MGECDFIIDERSQKWSRLDFKRFDLRRTTIVCYEQETIVQKRALTLTPLNRLFGLGVLSPRQESNAVLRPNCFASPTFMKSQRIKAALSKARARLAATEKAAKSALTLAESLKKNVKDAKRAFKESRRTYKQVRKFFKTASRDQNVAEKAFKKSFARLTKLETKAEKQVHKVDPQNKTATKSPPAKKVVNRTNPPEAFSAPPSNVEPMAAAGLA